MTPNLYCVALVFLALGFAGREVRGQVIYVDDDAPIGGDGQTWQTAFRSLQDALAHSGPWTPEVRVAQGVYRPTARTQANDARTATFRLVNGVTIKGGYAGITSPSPDDRDIDRFKSILSGDLAGDDGSDFTRIEDNAFHVVTSSITDGTARLEGFVITRGHARWLATPNSTAYAGSGLYNYRGQPTIRQCTFVGPSRGIGTIYSDGGTISIESCKIICNGQWTDAPLSGGVVIKSGGRVTLNGSIISGNIGQFGSAIYIDTSSSCSLVNCVVSGNFGYDAAIRSENSLLSITNCTIANNTNIPILPGYSSYSAGLALSGGVIRIANTIIWENSNEQGNSESAQIQLGGIAPDFQVNYACIQGWTGIWGGIGNTNQDPAFVDPDGPDNVSGTADDDYRLQAGSPCLDAADNLVDTDAQTPGIQPIPPTDLAGRPRFLDDPATPDHGNGAAPIVDMGALEGVWLTFEVDSTTITLAEGATGSFHVWLRQPPTELVVATVERVVGASDVSISSGATLSFDTSNWSIPQEVVLSSADDAGFTNDNATIRISSESVAAKDVFVTILDNEAVPRIVYVNCQAADGGTGNGWAEAFRDLESALGAARARTGVEEIWVAMGSYRPSRRTIAVDPRSASFELVDGVKVFGGFAGTESSLEQRDPPQNETILTGDRSGDDAGGIHDLTRDENSYHILLSSKVGTTTTLDGFTITGGHANKRDPQSNGKEGAGLFNEGGSPVIQNCLFSSNYAQDVGGAMVLTQGKDIRVVNCSFRNNENGPQGYGGGAVACVNSSVLFNGCLFVTNTASGYSYGLGGGISVKGPDSDIRVNHCAFHGNQAVTDSQAHLDQSFGGAIGVFDGSLLIDRSDFVANKAVRGGAIANLSSKTAHITECTFASNLATGSSLAKGGAVYTGYSDLTILSKCDFDSNFSDSYGGGLAADSPTKVFDCVFTRNQAQRGGGAIARGGPFTFENCEFVENETFWQGSGGGLDVANARVDACRFVGNHSFTGGALTIYSGLVDKSLFLQNVATAGGAVAAHDSTLSNCVIAGNSADNRFEISYQGYFGGGIYTTGSNIKNCVLSGNRSLGNGGAVFKDALYQTDRLILQGCSLVGNSSENRGGGLYMGGGDAKLNNSILWANTAQSGDAQLAGQPVVPNYSCIQNWLPTQGGIGNFSMDPLFVNAIGPDGQPGTEDDDLHLGDGSPCVNAGDDDAGNLLPTDFEGQPRIQGCRVDVGADESSQSTFTDCNHNGIADDCEIADGAATDCNHNHIPDECDIANEASNDFNENGVPDECEAIRYYVDCQAHGAGAGANWNEAFNDLQLALAAASSHSGPVEIWVARGTYSPSSNDGDRAASFHLQSRVAIYGGFSGTESLVAQRDPQRNETVLSGDLMHNDSPEFGNIEDNSHHVVTATDVDESAILDGFLILGGNADSYPYAFGGGILINYASPTVINCTIRQNRSGGGGGGMSVLHGQPDVLHCRFIENTTLYNGGGLSSEVGGRPVLRDCTFERNSAVEGGALGIMYEAGAIVVRCKFINNQSSGMGGGAINIVGSDWVSITDSLFAGNQTTGAGGAITSSTEALLELRNCTITENRGEAVGGVYLWYGPFVATNCIFWENQATYQSGEEAQLSFQVEPGGPLPVNYCCIQGLQFIEGTGNIGLSPVFAHAGLWDNQGTPWDPGDDSFKSGDYHLVRGSPCINTGDPNYSPQSGDADIDGQDRMLNGRVDMGADEYSKQPVGGSKVIAR